MFGNLKSLLKSIFAIILTLIICCSFIKDCNLRAKADLGNREKIEAFVSGWNYTATPLDYDKNGYDLFRPITNNTGINIKSLSVDAIIYNEHDIRTDTCNLTIEHWKDGEIVYFDRYAVCNTAISKAVFIVNSFEEES